MTNIVDFAKFQKAKKQKTEEQNEDNSVLAILNDRMAFLLNDGKSIQEFEGGRPGKIDPVTRVEALLISQIYYLETALRDFVAHHAPHRLLDDYLTYPYIEWNELATTQTSTFQAWHEKFVEEPGVSMAREAHVLIKDIRAMAAMLGFTDKIGFISGEPGDMGKLICSPTSPFVFRINGVADIADSSLCVTFKLKDGCTDPAGLVSGEIFIPQFWVKQERVTFMALLFTAPSSFEFLQQAESLIQAAKAGHVRVEK